MHIGGNDPEQQRLAAPMNSMNNLFLFPKHRFCDWSLLVVLLAVCWIGSLQTAQAGGHDVIEKRYFLRSQGASWHSAWYSPWEGRPLALVVPPTAEFTTEYSWGVPSSRVLPLVHQYHRPYPGPGAVSGRYRFRPTPNQPSDTVQFGVQSIRGPW
jgi:hypothetical protein